MIEEEVDVEEACDAGLVDREDLVDEKSKHSVLPPLLSSVDLSTANDSDHVAFCVGSGCPVYRSCVAY